MASGKGGRVTISMVMAANAKVARELDKFAARTSRNFAQISKQMAIMNRRGSKTVSVTDKMSRSLTHLSRLGNLTVAYKAFQRITQVVRDFATEILNVMSHLADFENRVKVAFGVWTDVGDHMEYVSKLSGRLGVNIRASRESFAKLSVAASLSGLKIGEIKEIYESVAEAARVYNLSADRTRLSFLAIEQMINKGKVSYEELRRQLGEQIPGAFQLAAKAMGVTTKELDQMLVKGELYTDEFLPKFARALRESVGDQLEEATTRGIANIARLTNATQKWIETFSNRELEEDVGDISKETSKLIENMDWLAISLQKVVSLLVEVGEVGVKAAARINQEIVGINPATRLTELLDLQKEGREYLTKNKSELTAHLFSMTNPPIPQNMKGTKRSMFDSLRWWTKNPDEKVAQVTQKYKDQGKEEFAPFALSSDIRKEEDALDSFRARVQKTSEDLEKIDALILKIYRHDYKLLPNYTGDSAIRKMVPNMAAHIRGRAEASNLIQRWEGVGFNDGNTRNQSRAGRSEQDRRDFAASEVERRKKIFDEQLEIQLGYEETEKKQRADHITAMMKAQEDFHRRELDERKKMMESWSEISDSVTSALKGLANNSLTAADALNRVAAALLDKFAYKPFENFLTDNLSSLFGAATGAGGGGGLSGVGAAIAALKGQGTNPGTGGGAGFNIVNNFGNTVPPGAQNAYTQQQARLLSSL